MNKKLVAMVKRTMPSVIANGMTSVQPMNGPVGNIFSLNHNVIVDIKKEYPTIYNAEKEMWKNNTSENIQLLKDLCELNQIECIVPEKECDEGCLYSRSSFRTEFGRIK